MGAYTLLAVVVFLPVSSPCETSAATEDVVERMNTEIGRMSEHVSERCSARDSSADVEHESEVAPLTPARGSSGGDMECIDAGIASRAEATVLGLPRNDLLMAL